MSPSIKKRTIKQSSLVETQVTPLEKEKLKIPNLEGGIHFFNGGCVVRAANRLEYRQAAYELLHNIYSKMGFVKNKSGGLWLSIFDALPETTTLVAEDNQGEIGATLTIVFDSPIGLPADALYKEEIDKLRHSGRILCEIISFGINGTLKGSLQILAGLYYCAWLLASHIKNSTDLVITVHARHEKFYCRNIFFKKIGPVRNYAKVNNSPTVLLNLPLILPSLLKKKRSIFPLSMLNYSDQEELEIAKKIENMLYPMSDEEFYTFFIEKTDTWEKASAEQKDYIKKVYPADQADHFSISRALARAVSKKHQYQNDNSE